MAAHQAPPSVGFSRQEHWSGFSFPFSNAWKWKVKVKSLTHVWLFVTPWTGAYQAPPSMEFSRQEYWNGLPLPSSAHYVSIVLKQNRMYCQCIFNIIFLNQNFKFASHSILQDSRYFLKNFLHNVTQSMFSIIFYLQVYLTHNKWIFFCLSWQWYHTLFITSFRL